MMGKLIFLSENSASSEAHGEVSVHSTDIIYFEGMTDVGKKKPETKMSRVDQVQSRKVLK